MDGDTAIASLACHFARPHSPSDVDIERNQVFAKLIAISLHARLPLNLDGPYFVKSNRTASDQDANDAEDQAA